MGPPLQRDRPCDPVRLIGLQLKVHRWLDILRLRARTLFRRGTVEQELEKELRFHLQEEAEEQYAAGLAPTDAQRAALIKLGGLAQIQEECRDMRRTNTVESLGQDLSYAARVLARSPGFTFVVILTLALSIGATTAIVSIIEGVLLRPLPFQDPGRLVRTFYTSNSFPKFPVNPNDFHDFRARLHSFESYAAYTHSDLKLSGTGETVRLSAFAVTGGFFHVLGLKPAMGREFDKNDELPARGRIAIVSDKIWRTRLGSRRDVLGQKIVLDAVPYTVVGVMPPGVQHPGNMYHAVSYGDTVDVWVPFTGYGDPNQRGSHYMDAIARLRPGVTVAQAQAEMNAAMRQLAREHPDGDSGWNIQVIPLETEIVGRSRRLLFILLGAAVLVLFLACVNAANLLLAKATARQREMAVRAAVGADRPRLIRQVLTESLVLAGLGAVLGSLLAVGGVKALVVLLPADFPRAGDIHVDLPVFLFALLMAIGTGIVFGIFPAIQGSRADLRESLHESGRSSTSSQQTLRLRNILVISEVTLACVLLIGACLMLRSFLSLLRADPGFHAERVVTASISLPEVTYKDAKSVALLSERLLREIHNTPGMSSAGMASDLPWTGWDDNAGGFQIDGETPPPHEEFSGRYHIAGPGFFQALGVPLIGGRFFDEHDRADSKKVMIVNQSLAKAWKHGSAVGGRITFNDHPKPADWMTVVGVVGDIKDAPKEPGAKPAFWWPMSQQPFSFLNFSVAIRSNLPMKTVAGRLRAVVRGLDSNLAVADVRTMAEIADDSYSTSRFAFVLVGMFAGLALILAAIGTYGVIAYSVSQRIHEFGIRMALGARPLNLVGGVLSSGIKLALLGTALGIVLGVALARLLGSLLYGVGSLDPLAIAATALIALAVAALACCVPALRATRANPMAALRTD